MNSPNGDTTGRKKFRIKAMISAKSCINSGD